jgi:hypothetical protein
MNQDKNLKRKMQNVNFKDIDEFFEFIPEHEKKIVEVLRSLILNNIPKVQEKLSYNVPYYKIHSTICFLWPSSILWGKKQTYTGVRLGFNNAHLLQDEFHILNLGDRKQVAYKDIQDISELTQEELDIIKTYLQEAVLIDEELYKEKKGRKR